MKMSSKLSEEERESRNVAALTFAKLFGDDMLTASMTAIMKKRLYGEHFHYDKNGVVDAVFAFTDGICMHFNNIHNFGERNVFKESLVTDNTAQYLNKRKSNGN